MSQATWPDPSFHIGQVDHLHALGVITATFNMLEFSLLCLFVRLSGINFAMGQRIFSGMPSNRKVELLGFAIEQSSQQQGVKDAARHFLKGFQILEKWRNTLVHSHTILNNPEQPHLTFGKGSLNQPAGWTFLHLTLPELRKIADELREFWLFGSRLDEWLFASSTSGILDFGPGGMRTPEFPLLPPLPRAMTPSENGVLE